MRHMIRRTIKLGLGVVALTLITFPPWGGATAQAQTFNEALRGEYTLGFTRVCSVEAIDGINSFVTFPIIITGTVNYDGSGSGTFIGTQVIPGGSSTSGTGLDTGAGTEIFLRQANVGSGATPCSVSYSVNSDGSFAQVFNCPITTTGFGDSVTGDSGTLNGISIPGVLALDGTILLLGNTVTDIETLNFTSGPSSPLTRRRVCNGIGGSASKR